MAHDRTDFKMPIPSLVRGCVLAGLVFSEAQAQELAPQPPKQRGAFFVPMVTIAETSDQNLFFTQFPESDLVTRVSVGAETGYRSTPFTINIQASRAGDYFQKHSDFDTKKARTLGQVAINYTPVRSLTLAVFACYYDTKTPSELNLISGLAVGRSLATRASITPAIEYRLGSRWTFTGAFPVAHDTLDGRTSHTRTANGGFDRRVSRRDTVGLRYEHRWFDFRGGNRSEQSTADVVTLGWMGEIKEHTLLLLRAGPRYGKGAFTAEVLATMKSRVRRGLITLTYSKTQATTLGKTGALDTQSLAGSVALRVAKNLEVASGPGLYLNSLRGQKLKALRLNVETLWHFSPWFHMGASYSFDLQQPDFGASGHIRRGAFQVKVITSPQQRGPEDAPLDTPRMELD